MNNRTRRNITAAMSLMAFCAFADKETVDGVIWNYETSTAHACPWWCSCCYYDFDHPKYVTVECSEKVKVKSEFMPDANETVYKRAISSKLKRTNILPMKYKGVLAVPERLGYNEVERIGKRAFEGCAEIKKLILPKGLRSIEAEAFKGCTGLTSIVIPPFVDRIGDGVFDGCMNLKEIEFLGRQDIGLSEDHYKYIDKDVNPVRGLGPDVIVRVPKNANWEDRDGRLPKRWMGLRLRYSDKEHVKKDDILRPFEIRTVQK